MKTKTTGIHKSEIKNKLQWYLLTIILIITIIIYWGSLKNAFINLDDTTYVITNPVVQKFNFANVSKAFNSFFEGDYLPLTIFSYMVDYAIGGLDPSIFHFTNLLLHLINILLVYLLTKKLFKRYEVALIAAALFAFHPMHSESVLWIAERKDVLYTAFYLGSLLSYLYFIEVERKPGYFILTLFLFLLSLLSKSEAVTLPLMLIAIDYFYSRRLNKHTVFEKIPFFVLSIIFGIITIVSKFDLPNKFMDNLTPIYSTVDRVFLVSYNFMFYLIKFFVPYHLSFFHVYPNKINGLLPLQFYLALPALVILVLLTIFKSGSLRKHIFLGALFYVIPLLLVIKILPFAGQLVAERYTYIPYIGLSFILGVIFIRYLETTLAVINKKYFSYFFIAVLIAFSFITFERVSVWKNSETLYSDVIAKEPDALEGYHGRGYARMTNFADYSGAIADFDKAIQIDPKVAELYNSRGWAEYKLGDLQKALNDFNKTISLDSTLFNAYSNRGIVKRNMHDLTGAMDDYDKSIELNHEYPNVYFNRAMLYLIDKDTSNAYADLQTAAKLGHADAEEVLKQLQIRK